MRVVALSSSVYYVRLFRDIGSSNLRVLVVISEFLFYYHCLSVYGVGLTALGIRRYVYEAP